VKAGSLCYAETLPPAPPIREGRYVHKVSMSCLGVEEVDKIGRDVHGSGKCLARIVLRTTDVVMDL
jgi:hypothetical protein